MIALARLEGNHKLYAHIPAAIVANRVTKMPRPMPSLSRSLFDAPIQKIINAAKEQTEIINAAIPTHLFGLLRGMRVLRANAPPRKIAEMAQIAAWDAWPRPNWKTKAKIKNVNAAMEKK